MPAPYRTPAFAEGVAVRRRQAAEDRIQALKGSLLTYLPHTEFKKRVPLAVGLVRTGDTIPYANVILEWA